MLQYKRRILEERILKYLTIFPVVALTGSRQAGKSTMLQHLFQDGWDYYSLDQRSVLETIRQDPDFFIKQQQRNFIIDEAQKLPEIFSAVKFAVDTGSSKKIILSGSANFLLLQKITETLAGRIGILELYPYAYSEIVQLGNPLFLSRLLNAAKVSELRQHSAAPAAWIEEYILNGGYPKVWEYAVREDRITWLENFRTTYLERDLHDLAQVASIHDFQRYYEMLAYQTGSLLNLSNIGRDIGITTNTSRKYFSVLVSSYQYFTLQPFYMNINKRLVKTPKVYVWDTGLGSFLLKYRNVTDMINSGRYGSIFENWVITELLKQAAVLEQKPVFYFWRTSNGAEVDLVVEYGSRLIPVEIKAAAVLHRESLRGIQNFLEDYKKRAAWGIVVYCGERAYHISDTILALPVHWILQ
ncbi:MAG: ATP-binding protein [Spirochaetota bacterium]